MFKISKTYKYFGYFCLFLGPIASVVLKNENLTQLGLLCFATVLTVIFGNHCIRKSESIIRELTIKSRLDEESLKLLQSLNGLMFTRDKKLNITIETIRYLISQEIIENEVFPSSPISFGYCLTTFGRKVLLNLGIKVFPEIIVEMYRIRYWGDYISEFETQKNMFNTEYSYKYDDILNKICERIPKLIKGKDKLDVFGKFLETEEIEYDEKINVINEYLK